ncbi:MAG: alpha/beta fold hydrolase [Polyangiales bacterium]
MTTRINRDFSSRGVRCAGTLYRPDGVLRPPCIVMGHGFGAERAWGLPSFAERFCGAGFAAFLFDYRGFGDSAGSPRRIVSPRRHIEDFEAAVEHVRAFADIDPEQLVLWGTSLGGGHALTLASRRVRCAAVIAHVPHVDAVASLAGGATSPAQLLKLVAAGLRDGLRAATFREPYYVPAVGRPREVAVMSTEDAWEGVMALVPPGAPFDNRCAARIALTFPLYRPIREVSRIRVPTLIVAAAQDSLIPIEAVRKTAARISNVRLIELDCSHFAPYAGEWFERSIEAQLDFLRACF